MHFCRCAVTCRLAHPGGCVRVRWITADVVDGGAFDCSLDSPLLEVCVIMTITSSAPATHYVAPLIPFTGLPGTVQVAGQ
jgi:hypothetical protein